jgi:D-glucuronyl C5-epimerase C-terminus
MRASSPWAPLASALLITVTALCAPAVATAQPSRSVLVLTPAGHTFKRPVLATANAEQTPAPTTGQAPGGARIAKAHGPTISAALRALESSGSVDASTYRQYVSEYAAATRSVRKLTGTRRTELQSVIDNLQAIAAAHGFIPSRLPALFLTLQRNRQWWTTGPLLSSGQRVSFTESRLVWEYYPGQGIEIQWLGTFGQANGYYLSGHNNANLRQLLAEVIPLATERAGGIAWEYLFQFDGGSPPWTSGLSQGTALQVLARAWSRLRDPIFLTSAERALGIFQVAPPVGVRVQASAGSDYVQYSYAPGDLILNGFIQALVGLYDYTAITGDPLGQQLFEQGDARARAELPRYDTGAWSMYDQYGESSLSYHELLTTFLSNLCKRIESGPPLRGTTATTVDGSGGSAPANASGPGADAIYCTTAERFKEDLHQPPQIALLSHQLRASARAGVRITLSKMSTVSLVVRQGEHVIWTNRATVAGGKPRLLWVTPAHPGTYSIDLSAVDLAGNRAQASGQITLLKATHH